MLCCEGIKSTHGCMFTVIVCDHCVLVVSFFLPVPFILRVPPKIAPFKKQACSSFSHLSISFSKNIHVCTCTCTVYSVVYVYVVPSRVSVHALHSAVRVRVGDGACRRYPLIVDALSGFLFFYLLIFSLWLYGVGRYWLTSPDCLGGKTS